MTAFYIIYILGGPCGRDSLGKYGFHSISPLFIMVAVTLFPSILLATAAFAFPTSIVPRSARSPSGVLQLNEASSQIFTNTTYNTAYSNNWAGAALDTYPHVRKGE